MWGSNSGQKPCNTIDTLIGAKTEIKGDVIFTGGLRIDGRVKGNIVAGGSEASTLVISEQASIHGNVTVPHLIVNGTVTGNVRATERLELQPKAAIRGDITYKTMEMVLGASVNGSLVHEAAENATAPKLKAVSASSPKDAE